MWLMTTKDRPQAAERALAACWETGMRQRGIVYVDGKNHTPYDDIKIPPNWEMVKWVDVGGIGNLAGSKHYIFEKYDKERVYGWMADDNIPVTQDWCAIVEEAAYPFSLVHCRDEFVSLTASGRNHLSKTMNLGGGICWGGDLVRCVGWWAPSGVVQGSIDWAWTSLVGETPIGVYRDDILVRHDNWRTGRREKDENDNLEKPFIKNDINYIKQYRQTRGFQLIRERILRESVRIRQTQC